MGDWAGDHGSPDGWVRGLRQRGQASIFFERVKGPMKGTMGFP